MHDEDALRVKALRAGAVGFLTKDCAMQEVVETVRRVAAGDTVFSPGDRRRDDGRVPAQRRRRDHRPRGSRRGVESPLTKREHEILQLVADGHSTTEIARTLFISAKTVKNHLASIYAKLDSRDRTQAVLERHAPRDRAAPVAARSRPALRRRLLHLAPGAASATAASGVASAATAASTSASPPGAPASGETSGTAPCPPSSSSV